MKRILIAIALLLTVNSYVRTDATAAFTSVGGKVFRSDKNEAIENAYVLLTQEKEPRVEAQHFDTRTDSKGRYQFTNLPAGKFTISISSWHLNRSDVPCGDASDLKTVDGRVTVKWQPKSTAFMEVVVIKGFTIEADHETARDFDIACRERTRLADARRNPTNRWTGATGSEFRIKRDRAKLLGSAVARSTQPLGANHELRRSALFLTNLPTSRIGDCSCKCSPC